MMGNQHSFETCYKMSESMRETYTRRELLGLVLTDDQYEYSRLGHLALFYDKPEYNLTAKERADSSSIKAYGADAYDECHPLGFTREECQECYGRILYHWWACAALTFMAAERYKHEIPPKPLDDRVPPEVVEAVCMNDTWTREAEEAVAAK